MSHKGELELRLAPDSHSSRRVEAALIQNSHFDVWHDDLASLAEDNAGASAVPNVSLSELQSFTDAAYTQDRYVSAVQWVPGRKVDHRVPMRHWEGCH